MKANNATIFYRDSVGGHLALDLLNTVSIVGGQQIDALQNDNDVLNWLIQKEVVDAAPSITAQQGELLTVAENLRGIIRDLIMVRKAGKPLSLTAMNSFLKQGPSYLQLQESNGKIEAVTHREIKTANQLLAPIAEAAVDILTVENFDLVRKCESTECVLWFYDRTKGHKRRWCSMAMCGNRHKVSSFRKRQAH